MEPIVPGPIEVYAAANSTSPSSLAEAIEQDTRAGRADARMLTGALEGAFLRLLVRISGARRVLEIGTFTGYSALTMAEALPADGILVTCDHDEATAGLARGYFDRSPHGHKVEQRLGNARDTLTGLDGQFDLAFLDADKESYEHYYEALLPLLRAGGLLVADNVLWSGRVLDPQQDTDHALARFNARVAADPRVEVVMLPLRDGVSVIYKKPGPEAG